MRREEFEAWVEEKAGPDLRGSDYLKATIYDFGRQGGPFYYSDVAKALQEAERRREKATSREEIKAPRRSSRPKPGAEAHFISRMLVHDLEPWTKELREEGFGSESAPYPADEGAAAEYIEKTSATEHAHWIKTRKNKEGDHERIGRLADDLGLDITTRTRFLPYGRPGDDHQKNAPVIPGTFLFKLAGEIDRMSRKTGLPSDALTAHVLTGAMPIMPRVRRTTHEEHFRLPSGKQAHLRSVTLTFRTADLTFEELRIVYKDLKSYMGGEGVQAPTLEDYELWTLVEEIGGPPEPYKGVREFWREVLKMWNREHPDAPLESWEGLQKKYNRVCEKLGIQ